MPDSYTVIHTNDFHNHLTDTQASALQTRRDALRGRGLLLDAGDAISAGNITFRPGGEPILDRMSATGYDAMTVGNREFHFSSYGFHCKLSRARFPILCANVRRISDDIKQNANQANHAECAAETEGNGTFEIPVRPWVSFELQGGFRVVVFGVTVPMITQRMLVRKVSAYVFEDPLATAVQLAPMLRRTQRPDLLIALTHIGIRQDRLLAERMSDIDLIIGGHTHVTLPEGERVGETLIVQAGSHGKWVGTVTIHPVANARPRLTAALEAL